MQVPANLSTCVACPPGSACDGAAATPCRAGTAAAGGAASCVPCLSGSVSRAGQAACSPCPAGTTASADAVGCVPCTSTAGGGCVSACNSSIAKWCPAGTLVDGLRGLGQAALALEQAYLEDVTSGGRVVYGANKAQVRFTQPFARAALARDAAGGSGAAVVAVTALLVVLACLPLALHGVLPQRVWLAVDIFGLAHHVRIGAWPVNQPTRWGAALTLAVAPLAVLVAVALATQGAATEIKASVVPLPTLGVAEQAQLVGTVELGLVAHGATAAECAAGLAAIAPPPGFEVFVGSRAAAFTQLASEGLPSACPALRLRCTRCNLVSGAVLNVSLPWRSVLVEYQLAYQSPDGGELVTAAGAPSVSAVLAAPAALAGGGCGSDGSLPGSPLPMATRVALSITPSLLVDAARGGGNFSGFAVSVQGDPAPTAPACAVFNDTTVSLTFELPASFVVYVQNLSPKQSALQIAAVVASSITTLLAVFAKLFMWSERLLPRAWLRRPGDHAEDQDGLPASGKDNGLFGSAGTASVPELQAQLVHLRLQQREAEHKHRGEMDKLRAEMDKETKLRAEMEDRLRTEIDALRRASAHPDWRASTATSGGATVNHPSAPEVELRHLERAHAAGSNSGQAPPSVTPTSGASQAPGPRCVSTATPPLPGEAACSNRALPPLREGWAETVDAGSGRTYWFCAASGASTWDRPTD
jgi:hypothetical protein